VWERKVIVFGVGRINRLGASLAHTVRPFEDQLLFSTIKQPLGIKSNADFLNNLGAPFNVVLRDRRSGGRLPGCRGVPISQNVRGELLRECLVEFEETVA
jgi:hypothetical protein